MKIRWWHLRLLCYGLAIAAGYMMRGATLRFHIGTVVAFICGILCEVSFNEKFR